MIIIKKENDIKKFNHYIGKIFNEENNHKLDLSDNLYKEDIFFIYHGGAIAGGFRLVYGENGLPLESLNASIIPSLNIKKIIEPGRFFTLKEFRKFHLYKYAFNFIDFFILNYKKSYELIVVDSILQTENLYIKHGCQRISTPFFDSSVTSKCDNLGNNSILIYKNIAEIILDKRYSFLETSPLPNYSVTISR